MAEGEGETSNTGISVGAVKLGGKCTKDWSPRPLLENPTDSYGTKLHIDTPVKDESWGYNSNMDRMDRMQ